MPWIEGVVFFLNNDTVVDVDNIKGKSKSIINGHQSLIKYFEKIDHNTSDTKNLEDMSIIQDLIWKISS
ncbi:hypothetical protein BC351_35390 [Paenibacillus ferrarius]|uniref:Uncharacterized protein n=1 Tax=Paenibacillus ferrarius TaxID=1469647 RepID=A0A1V4HCN4_9BACL|nr:hypothetical protein BC351_35390 [Paenibacillus ferrarius]